MYQGLFFEGMIWEGSGNVCIGDNGFEMVPVDVATGRGHAL